ncbi:MAG: HlyD family efflux transporter periplasmic adaptor subunit [Oscillospiraceae bacterium]|nr:HlyD family efflux transporter periplasmic adaptor subunit [Oscillospiraceae bacterium]
METTVKKREWVKDAAIIFLAVLLVLTFFSNTIMNRSLPEVATAAVGSGNIIAKVRGTGTVTATGKHQVKAKEIRTIRSVMVKVGQEVSTGDVLFVLGQGDETTLEQAKDRLRTLQYEYERTALNAPIYDGSSYDRAVDSAYEKLLRAEQRYNDAADDYYYALEIENSEIISINREIDEIQRQLDEMLPKLNQAEEDYNNRIDIAWQRYYDLQYQFDQEYSETGEYPDRTALDAAEKELDDIQNDTYLTSLRTQREYLQNRYDELNNHRSGLTSASAARYQTAMDDAEYELYLAQIDYDNAINSREYSYQSFDQNVAVVGVNLQEIAEQIAVQQEKIKSLAGDEENVITANVSGVIDTIDCTAGDTVNKDALLCTIEVPDMGHTLSFSVTNDQAQRLRIGDTATISNYYWGNSVTATLTTIRTDPKNPQTNKVLTFDLEGDVTSGAEMTISVGQKSANYDIIVPNSAIKSDNNGSFVLAVQVKSSPLGNRYTAKRVSVEVLANDDNNSAVVADLNNGDYVITTSSSPVSSGDMVRIADNQT